MKTEVILEMIRSNEIDLLQEMLEEEIYLRSLGTGEQIRYKAMKNYFKFASHYINPAVSVMMKPCGITMLGKDYYCFSDTVSVVLTEEGIGGIEEYDNSSNDYFNLSSLPSIDFRTTEMYNLNEFFARVKAEGYKYCKAELVGDKCTFLKYKNSYYKMGLLDKAFSIINDGDMCNLHHAGGAQPLLIETSLGSTYIFPFIKDRLVEFESHICVL